ncbi:MAG: hypothetical protein OEX82_00905 [Nitrosomonas sp.]|nr:hypothetical protein [Nitrosomonas sp.]
MSSQIPENPENSDTVGCPLKAGLERHVWPSGDGKGVVTKTSSDAIFGPDGLGLASSVWMKILSFLARTGIQDQTGSKPGETSIEACVKGWGQGACSSRVFNPETGVDEEQLERFIAHLQGIAKELGVPNQRITGKVLAVFISTQDTEPYMAWDGIRTVKSARDRFTARFRGHVQWQGFDTLCSQIGNDGIKYATPELIREFFNSEMPFFDRIVERRRGLRNGTLSEGEKSGLLADVPAHIDCVATDREYKKNKSGLWLILKIGRYILFPKKSKLGPLLEP